jgi:ornithine carbamoyltransferase
MDVPVSPQLLQQDATPTRDGAALLQMARTLRTMAQSGREPRLLRGKYLALLSPERHSPSQGALERAARRLGAQVARVPASSLQDGDTARIRDTARMLGRLYDALDCEGLPAQILRRVQQDSGVPVYDGLGRKDHPLAQLLPCLCALASRQAMGLAEDDEHGFLLQAMLVQTLL